MSTRKEHLNAIVRRIHRAAYELGIGPDASCDWEIDPGSKTYGRNWGLYWRNKETGALHSPAGMNAHLGLTYAEAEMELYRIADTLEAVIWTKAQRTAERLGENAS